MEPKPKRTSDTMPSPGWRSSTVISKKKPSVTTFLGMAPMLDSLTESMGGGFKVSVGGRELFSSRAYIQLQASDMPLFRRSIPMDFHECEGSVEILSLERNPEGLLQMAELAMKGEIATGVVHDANNLLCALNGNLDVIATMCRHKAPEMKAAVTEMQVALDSLSSAMNRMRGLLLSKKEIAGLNVRDVVDSAFLLIKKRLQVEWSMRGKEVAVLNAVPKNLRAEMVFGDVQLAVVNIMLNAVEHGIEKKGRIDIRGYQEGLNVYIEIENDGRPVPDSVRSELLAAPVTTDCNNGVGLYSSAKTLRVYGGDITYESDAESTAFTIRLPASGTCG